MIRTIRIKVNAAYPQLPLEPVELFEGSAASFTICDVPRAVGKREVTGIALQVKNADGAVTSFAAVRVGSAWEVTATADALGGSGFVGLGVRVNAYGTDENGALTSWIIGMADLKVMTADGTVNPGESVVYTRLLDAEPETPHKGDLCKIGGVWKLFTGSAWETIGGGGGGAVDSVNGKTGVVVLTGGDIPYIGETSVSAKLSALTLAVGDAESAAATAKATAESAQRAADDADADASNALDAAADAGTKADEAKEEAKLVRMTLVGDGTAANPYAVQLDGVSLTFAQIKDYAVGRSAVIQHGQGTYRVTYVGSSEMMWDCTGTVQGTPKTGMIHIFASGDVVQLVPAKELLTPSALPYKLNADGTIVDRAINAVTSGAWTIPSGFTDLLIRFTGAPVSLTFAEAGIVDFGDAIPSDSGDYLITVTRTKTNEAFVRVLTITERA